MRSLYFVFPTKEVSNQGYTIHSIIGDTQGNIKFTIEIPSVSIIVSFIP